MPERISLQYPAEKLEENRRLREPLQRFEYGERVPVIFGASGRFVLHGRGVGFLEYFAGPKAQLRHQLLNLKWKLENVPGDWLTNGSSPASADSARVPIRGSWCPRWGAEYRCTEGWTA